VFAVRTFSDDGGDLMSQLRGEKKRWARTDAAIAAIQDGIAKSPCYKWFFCRRRRMDPRRRLSSGSETAHELLHLRRHHLFTAGEQFNADI
jgi:hypothetical protein